MSPMLVPARRLDPEWMDRDGIARADLEGALGDIRTVNRRLGGSSTLVRAVAPHLRGGPRPFTILDVGTGGADLPVDLVAAGRAAGADVRVVAVDRDPVTAAIARRHAACCPEVTVVEADAFDLPFPERSFDLVIASMFLHHFDHGDAVKLLRGFRRLARRAVLINDLRRHRLPWAFIGFAARLTRRHPMFVHDAPLSVLRGFTDDELLAAAREAGAPDPRVERRFPFRLVLTIPCDEGAA